MVPIGSTERRETTAIMNCLSVDGLRGSDVPSDLLMRGFAKQTNELHPLDGKLILLCPEKPATVAVIQINTCQES